MPPLCANGYYSEHDIMYHLCNLSKTLTRKFSMLFLARFERVRAL